MTTTAEKVATEKTGAPDKIRRALGRGLESLLPGGPRVVAGTATAAAPGQVSGVVPEIQAQAARAATDDALVQISLDRIDQNPYQTRTEFNPDLLQELADSIRANGLVQPIVVRPAKDGRYTLILGERRCRASKMAGKTTVPAIVRRVSEQQAAEMTIIENLQREDLNCMEQASAFAELSKKFGLTQEQIGDRVGLSRESVSNYMRLLKLPERVRDYLYKNALGFSEARMLLQFNDPELITKLADEAVRKHMSVDQLEDLCIKQYVREEPKEQGGRARWVDPNVRAAQRELETALGCRVRIRDRKGKGKIVIEYATLEDFDRVVGMLKGK
jgi:ParB family chromosome partitioning protein